MNEVTDCWVHKNQQNIRVNYLCLCLLSTQNEHIAKVHDSRPCPSIRKEKWSFLICMAECQLCKLILFIHLFIYEIKFQIKDSYSARRTYRYSTMPRWLNKQILIKSQIQTLQSWNQVVVYSGIIQVCIYISDRMSQRTWAQQFSLRKLISDNPHSPTVKWNTCLH